MLVMLIASQIALATVAKVELHTPVPTLWRMKIGFAGGSAIVNSMPYHSYPECLDHLSTDPNRWNKDVVSGECVDFVDHR